MQTKDFCQAWNNGGICLHPTDTLPGLSVNWKDKAALQKFSNWKGRAPDKPWVHLAADHEQAFSLWSSLPERWVYILQELWPASLSVVWWDQDHKETLCLRVPKDIPNWLRESVREIGPLPTTSFNLAGDPPLCDWVEVKEIALKNDFFVPKGQYTSQKKPSTVIRILESGAYEVLREGCVLANDISDVYKRFM